MLRKFCFAVLLTLALALVSACGGESPSGGVGVGGDATAKPTTGKATAKPTKEAGDEPTEETGGDEPTEETGGDEPTEETRGNEEGSLNRLDKGLEQLDSYRMRFVMSFEGKDDKGADAKGSMEIVQDVIKGSKNSHSRFATEGSFNNTTGGMGAGLFETFQVGDTMYMVTMDPTSGEETCIGISSEDIQNQPTNMMNPSSFIGGLSGAKLVKRGEEVNGIKADHFSFDQSNISFGAFASASGDVWIAQDGGYPVKYIGKASGKDVALWMQGEGTVTWEYTLEDVNQLEEIEIPAKCEGQSGATDIPIHPSAKNKSSFGGTIVYTTSESAQTIADFYKDELEGAGWTAGEGMSLPPDLITLIYRNDGRELSVTITSASGDTSVLIAETK